MARGVACPLRKGKSTAQTLIDDVLLRLGEAKPRPQVGWVKLVREALGMTRAQLAERTGVSPSTVNTLERSEARGTISIASLEKLANGLGGRLVYAIVPPVGKTFEQLVNERAKEIAEGSITVIDVATFEIVAKKTMGTGDNFIVSADERSLYVARHLHSRHRDGNAHGVAGSLPRRFGSSGDKSRWPTLVHSKCR